MAKADDDFDALARRIENGFAVTRREAQRLLNEVLELHVLIQELRMEGCPWREEGGRHFCAYCDAVLKDKPGDEPIAKHEKDCVWLKIESVALRPWNRLAH